MLVLYGALVEYDSLGTPAPMNTSDVVAFHGGDPLAHVEKTYPCMSISIDNTCISLLLTFASRAQMQYYSFC